MIDIVFAEGDPKAFVERSRLLGHTALVTVYPSLQAARDAQRFATDYVRIGVLCDEKHARIARKEGFLVVARSKGDDRSLLDHAKPDVLFGMERIARKDSPHQRRSGLNHVLAKVAKRHGTLIGMSFASLLEDRCREVLLGRWMQNAMLCRKFAVPVVCASFAMTPAQMRSPADLQSLFSLVGVARVDWLAGQNAISKKINCIG